MLTFFHIFSASKQNPTKKNSSMARSEWKKTHSSEWWVCWCGAILCDRRGASGFIGDLVRVGSTISLLSLLSLSLHMVRKWRDDLDDRWLGSTRVGLNNRSDAIALLRCDLVVFLLRQGDLLALSLSLSLSPLFSKAGNHLKWKWKRKSFSTVLAIFYSQPRNAFQFDSIWSNNQTPIFSKNHF